MTIERIESHGVVGAGGGGFPTAVKLRTQASILLVNAAECEPLLHKDKELLKHQAEPMLRGLQVAMACVGAEEAITCPVGAIDHDAPAPWPGSREADGRSGRWRPGADADGR